MSKTTPVRWWRDDATRYQSRPPYVPPPSPPPQRWLFDLVSTAQPVHPPMRQQGIIPQMADMLSRTRAIAAGLGIPHPFDQSRERPMRNHDNPRRSLLDTGYLPQEDRAVLAEIMRDDSSVRPGVWADQDGADLRLLTQQETNTLIAGEVWFAASHAERDEIERVVGPPREVELVRGTGFAFAIRQRGGIHSDEMIRMLSYRVWGERDMRWFELRGVRRGDVVTLDGDGTCAQFWSRSFADHPHGVAIDDARPGEIVIVKSRRTGDQHRFRVSDRLRENPGHVASDVDADVRRFFDTGTWSHSEKRDLLVDWKSAKSTPIEDVNNLVQTMLADGRVRNIGHSDDLVDAMGHALQIHGASYFVVSEERTMLSMPTMPAQSPTFRPGAKRPGEKPAPATPPWARRRRGSAWKPPNRK